MPQPIKQREREYSPPAPKDKRHSAKNDEEKRKAEYAPQKSGIPPKECTPTERDCIPQKDCVPQENECERPVPQCDECCAEYCGERSRNGIFANLGMDDIIIAAVIIMLLMDDCSDKLLILALGFILLSDFFEG